MQLPRNQREDAVLGQLKRLYGPFAELEDPIEIVEQIWQVRKITGIPNSEQH